MTNVKEYTDEELAALLAGEESAAFEEIFDRYWLQLYTKAYKRVKIKEVAEEIVQDLFTSLWIKRKSLRITTSLAAYLFTSVKYLVLNNLQKEGVKKVYLSSVRSASTDINCTEETILANDLNLTIEKEITHLPVKCRSVFELSRKQYKTNKEIASMLGISEKTVENHLTKALRRLRVNLNDVICLGLMLLFRH